MPKEKLIIGPSTGWLYAIEIYNLAEQEEFAKKAGANCVEMCTASIPERMAGLLLNPEMFREFDFKSAHLDYDPKSSLSLDEQVNFAKLAREQQRISAAVIHPVNIPQEYWEKIAKLEIPFAFGIENMDRNKPEGFKINDLERLLSIYSLGFVLDVQHAYEHDPAMGYAQELLEMGKNRLTHLHVSGETPYNNHSLVYHATNKRQILDFTKRILDVKNVPIILEGEYRDGTELTREINFLKKELVGSS